MLLYKKLLLMTFGTTLVSCEETRQENEASLRKLQPTAESTNLAIKATDTHAQDFVANNVLLSTILTSFAQCTRSLKRYCGALCF